MPDSRHTLLLLSADVKRRSELAAVFLNAGLDVIEAADRAAVADRVRDREGFLVIDLDAPGQAAPLLEELRQPRAPGADWSLEAVERRHIRATLEHTRGNRREAALLLGIARSTLLAKLRRYGLDQPDATEPA